MISIFSMSVDCVVYCSLCLSSFRESSSGDVAVNPHLIVLSEDERDLDFAFASSFSSSVGALKLVIRSALDLRVLSGPWGLLELVSLDFKTFFFRFSSSESESESYEDPKPNQLRQKDFSSLCDSSLRFRSSLGGGCLLSFWMVEVVIEAAFGEWL